MAITGNASYLSTMNEFLAHWAQADALLAPGTFVVRLEGKDSTVTRAQFTTMRNALQTQETVVQSRRADQQIACGIILM